jgi:hypothetical protein
MTPIDALKDSVSRAEKSGHTDEENARFDLAKEMGHKIIDILEADAYRSISQFKRLTVLAGIMGCEIKVNRIAGPLSGALVASELCQIIVDVATEEDQ